MRSDMETVGANEVSGGGACQLVKYKSGCLRRSLFTHSQAHNVEPATDGVLPNGLLRKLFVEAVGSSRS